MEALDITATDDVGHDNTHDVDLAAPNAHDTGTEETIGRVTKSACGSPAILDSHDPPELLCSDYARAAQDHSSLLGKSGTDTHQSLIVPQLRLPPASTYELGDESPDRHDILAETSRIGVPLFRPSTLPHQMQPTTYSEHLVEPFADQARVRDTSRHIAKAGVQFTMTEPVSPDVYMPDVTDPAEVSAEIGRLHSKLTATVGGTASAKRDHGSEEAAVDPVSFDDMIYTLGTIDHRHDVSVQPRQVDSKAVRKHLRLMDLLSLLLVTEEHGDVASAAFCRRADGLLTVVFAKNRPCNDAEVHYIRLLAAFILALAQPCKDAGSILSALLATIFSNCENNIRATHRAMVKALDALGRGVRTLPRQVGQTLWNKVCSRFSHYTEQCKGQDDTCRAQAFILLWSSKMKEPLTKESWKFVVEGAWIITSTEELVEQDFMQVHVNDRTIYESMRCYAEYYDAIRMFVSNVRRYKVKPESLFLVEAKVEPAPRIKSTPGESALDLLNRFQQHRDPASPLFSANDVIQAFPALSTSALVVPQSSREHVGVHPECAVALFLIKFGLLEHQVWKVGISNGMCWMCRRFLRRLSKTTGTTSYFSSYHGKIYPGWTCPADVFPNFLNVKQAYTLPTSKYWTSERFDKLRLPDQLASDMRYEVHEQVAWICDKLTGRKRREDCALDSDPEELWPLNEVDTKKAKMPVDEVAIGLSLLSQLESAWESSSSSE